MYLFFLGSTLKVCDFEMDFCSFLNEYCLDEGNWNRSSGIMEVYENFCFSNGQEKLLILQYIWGYIIISIGKEIRLKLRYFI